jgi:hypothetical protein
VGGAFGDDPDLRDAAAQARHEWRVEQDDAARDAYTLWRRTRSLDDGLREAMARGDRVEVSIAPHVFVGTIVAVADDLVAVRDRPGRPRVDVRRGTDVALVVRVIEAAADPGRPAGRDDDGGFVGRLRSRDAAAERCAVRLGRVGALDGAVVIVDDDGRETWCALGAVVAVTSAPPPTLR